MAEAKHTEIAQNLLIKEQPRKVKKKETNTKPNTNKIDMNIYSKSSKKEQV